MPTTRQLDRPEERRDLLEGRFPALGAGTDAELAESLEVEQEERQTRSDLEIELPHRGPVGDRLVDCAGSRKTSRLELEPAEAVEQTAPFGADERRPERTLRGAVGTSPQRREAYERITPLDLGQGQHPAPERRARGRIGEADAHVDGVGRSEEAPIRAVGGSSAGERGDGRAPVIPTTAASASTAKTPRRSRAWATRPTAPQLRAIPSLPLTAH